MPCRDDYLEILDSRIKNALEPLLCEACDLLEKHDLLVETSDELKVWAKNHENRETERVKREALAKLSPKERCVLGLT